MSEPLEPSRATVGDELASWQEAWQDPPAAPAAALDAEVAKVKRWSRRFGTGLVALTISELLVCIATTAYAAYFVSQQPTPWRIALLILTVLLVSGAEVLVLLNRRGTYRPRNATTQAFVELEWLRAQRQLRTIRWCLPFFLVEILSVTALRLWELASDPARAGRIPELVVRFGLVGGVSFALLALATWLWRRKVRRKMKELAPLRAAFAPPADPQ